MPVLHTMHRLACIPIGGRTHACLYPSPDASALTYTQGSWLACAVVPGSQPTHFRCQQQEPGVAGGAGPAALDDQRQGWAPSQSLTLMPSSLTPFLSRAATHMQTSWGTQVAK